MSDRRVLAHLSLICMARHPVVQSLDSNRLIPRRVGSNKIRANSGNESKERFTKHSRQPVDDRKICRLSAFLRNARVSSSGIARPASHLGR